MQAAQQGQGKAQYELANRLAAKPDYPDAMRWMKQAADQVGPLAADADIRGKAALQVRSWYQAGLGEPKNLVLAKPWWQRSAKLGNGEASYQLGQECRQRHRGKLVSECLDWFEHAAKRDHGNAQLVLGQWYGGQAGADEEAVKWLEKAAEQGNRDAHFLEKGHARNDAVLVMRKEGLAHWKKISGYHRRSLAETTMYGFKQLLAGKVSLRNYNGQVG